MTRSCMGRRSSIAGDHAAGRITTQHEALPAFREDVDGHFVSLINRLDEVLFRELQNGGPGRLPAEAQHPSQPRDVHRVVGRQGFQGTVLGERHTHALQRLIHGHLEMVLTATQHHDEFPRVHELDGTGVAHAVFIPRVTDTRSLRQGGGGPSWVSPVGMS